jgi:hypothetical protein
MTPAVDMKPPGLPPRKVLRTMSMVSAPGVIVTIAAIAAKAATEESMSGMTDSDRSFGLERSVRSFKKG